MWWFRKPATVYRVRTMTLVDGHNDTVLQAELETWLKMGWKTISLQELKRETVAGRILVDYRVVMER